MWQLYLQYLLCLSRSWIFKYLGDSDLFVKALWYAPNKAISMHFYMIASWYHSYDASCVMSSYPLYLPNEQKLEHS